MEGKAPMDSIDEFASDRAGAEILRQSLRALADQHAGTPLGAQIEAVLAGRADMRDLAGDPELATLAHEGVRQYAAQWAAMTPEERAALVEQATAIDAALNEQPGRDGR